MAYRPESLHFLPLSPRVGTAVAASHLQAFGGGRQIHGKPDVRRGFGSSRDLHAMPLQRHPEPGSMRRSPSGLTCSFDQLISAIETRAQFGSQACSETAQNIPGVFVDQPLLTYSSLVAFFNCIHFW